MPLMSDIKNERIVCYSCKKPHKSWLVEGLCSTCRKLPLDTLLPIMRAHRLGLDKPKNKK